MTAQEMRALAREIVLSCGGRGFMRFADDGDALLICDAARRCSEEAAQTMAAALEEQGFVVSLEDGMLLISPGDAMLDAINAEASQICWDEMDYAAQALAARLLRSPKLPLTPAGRSLARESLRLTGRPGEDVLAGLGALRAQAALMLRTGDRSGMYEAGAILKAWCDGRNEHED